MVISFFAALLALLVIRMSIGTVVRITDDHLVLQQYWPLRRRIRWYRVHRADLMPGYWVVVIELNSGQRIELPCVEHVDELFEQIDFHRKALDAPQRP